MAIVANGMFGGELPWSMVAIGGGIAVAIIVVDEILRRRGSSFRTPVLAVGGGHLSTARDSWCRSSSAAC